MHFNYDADEQQLRVTSNKFLEIKNDALGYEIKYLLNIFTKDEDIGTIYYEGPAYFEDLKGTPEQQLQWKKNRVHAYEGSAMEFLRSLLANKMEKAGFKVNKLARKLNPDFDRKKDPVSNMYIQKVIDAPLVRSDFLMLTAQKDLFTITSAPDTCLYVRYTKDNDLTSAYEKTIYRPHNDRYAITSIIIFKSRYALFDFNGVIVNPESISYEGFFGENRVGNQLPNDFQATE